MFDFWATELTVEEEDTLIDKVVHEIRKRKLEAPAIIFFESHKALSFVASQAAVVSSPFLIPFLGFDNVNNYSRLISKRENIEKLLNKLDGPSNPRVLTTEEACTT